MSTPEVTKFNSSFTWNTFTTTPNESNYTHYQKRIIKLYSNKYPSLNDWTTEQINKTLESRKLNQFKLLEQQKKDKEKQEKEQADKKDNDENKNADENANEENDKKDDKKDENKNENKNENQNENNKDENKDNSTDKKEQSKPIPNIELNTEQKKLIKALELLENEYFGNEHNLYIYLCTKYKTKIISEYNNNSNKVIDKLLETPSNIKCSECAEIKPYYSYGFDELLNGYFAACKECAPDRDSVKTLKWSPIFKSNDTQLKHNNFVLQNSRDGHRYACVDMTNSMKQGIHCFRWYVKGHRSWLLLGISKPKKHRDGSYSDQGVFGIASAGTYYQNGATKYDVPAAAMYAKQEILVDMKLDLSKYELSYMVVGDGQKKLMKISGIDKNNKDGYIPHVNVYYQSITLQIKKIPSSWFGKNPKRCKFKY